MPAAFAMSNGWIELCPIGQLSTNGLPGRSTDLSAWRTMSRADP